jgi:hypothetical protein
MTKTLWIIAAIVVALIVVLALDAAAKTAPPLDDE